MSGTHRRRRPALISNRPVAIAAVAVVAAAALSLAPWANATNGNLPAGTAIAVDITSPTAGQSYLPGADVTVTGTASVGTGAVLANSVLVTAVDISGSTGQSSGGTSCGDANGDGGANQIIDCEVAAAVALNNSAASLGTVADVGVVGFGAVSATADVGPGAGDQVLTGPATDAGGLAGSDVNQVFRAMRLGVMQQFTSKNVNSSDTNFGAALTSVAAALNASGKPNKVVAFVSDGLNGTGPDVTGPIAALPAGTKVYTFAVGSGSNCSSDPNGLGSLQEIATKTGATCTQVTNPNLLPSILPDVVASELSSLTLSVDGGTPAGITDVTPALPQAGPGSVTYSAQSGPLAVGPHDLCVTAHGSDAGGTGQVQECVTIEVAKATPTLRTQASPSAPVGSFVTDTATVSAGANPTGEVTFSLYGPNDPTCSGPAVHTSTKVLAGGSATSSGYQATAPGVYRWVAVYSGDGNNESVPGACNDPDENVTVTERLLTGRAYGVGITGTRILGIVVPDGFTPDTGHISTTSSGTYTKPCGNVPAGTVTATLLCPKVVTDATYPGKSTASQSVATARVGISLLPVIELRAVEAKSTTTCAGSTGSTTIAYLKVGSTVVISKPTAIAPNTKVVVGPVTLILNEQIAFSTPDQGLTVNAVHIKADVLGLVKTNIVISSAESDIGNCPVASPLS